MSRFEELLTDACRAAREEFEARSAQALAANARDRLLAEAWAARPGEVTWASMLRRVNEALPVAGRVRYGTLRKWVRDGSAGLRGTAVSPRNDGRRAVVADERPGGAGSSPLSGALVAGDPGA